MRDLKKIKAEYIGNTYRTYLRWEVGDIDNNEAMEEMRIWVKQLEVGVEDDYAREQYEKI